MKYPLNKSLSATKVTSTRNYTKFIALTDIHIADKVHETEITEGEEIYLALIASKYYLIDKDSVGKTLYRFAINKKTYTELRATHKPVGVVVPIASIKYVADLAKGPTLVPTANFQVVDEYLRSRGIKFTRAKKRGASELSLKPSERKKLANDPLIRNAVKHKPKKPSARGKFKYDIGKTYGQYTITNRQKHPDTGEVRYSASTPNSPFDRLFEESDLTQTLKLDAAREESRISNEALKARIAEEDKVKEEAYNDVDGFADGMTNLARSRALKTLNTKASFNGELLTRKEKIKSIVTGGGHVEETGVKRRLFNKQGSFLDQKDLTKTGMDYAEFLLAKKVTSSKKKMTQKAKDALYPRLFELYIKSTTLKGSQARDAEIASIKLQEKTSGFDSKDYMKWFDQRNKDWKQSQAIDQEERDSKRIAAQQAQDAANQQAADERKSKRLRQIELEADRLRANWLDTGKNIVGIDFEKLATETVDKGVDYTSYPPKDNIEDNPFAHARQALFESIHASRLPKVMKNQLTVKHDEAKGQVFATIPKQPISKGDNLPELIEIGDKVITDIFKKYTKLRGLFSGKAYIDFLPRSHTNIFVRFYLFKRKGGSTVPAPKPDKKTRINTLFHAKYAKNYSNVDMDLQLVNGGKSLVLDAISGGTDEFTLNLLTADSFTLTNKGKTSDPLNAKDIKAIHYVLFDYAAVEAKLAAQEQAELDAPEVTVTPKDFVDYEDLKAPEDMSLKGFTFNEDEDFVVFKGKEGLPAFGVGQLVDKDTYKAKAITEDEYNDFDEEYPFYM